MLVILNTSFLFKKRKDATEPSRGTFTFTNGDAIANLAKKNGQLLRGKKWAYYLRDIVAHIIGQATTAFGTTSYQAGLLREISTAQLLRRSFKRTAALWLATTRDKCEYTCLYFIPDELY